MKKFFLIQCGIIIVFLLIQMYVQYGHEGGFEVVFKTIENFAMLFSLTLILAAIVTGFRRLLNRNVNLAEGILRLCIFVLPFYYVVQLLGWLNR